jgi:hypothetical protein
MWVWTSEPHEHQRETAMLEQKWFPAGATYAQQAFINGSRYVVAPHTSIYGGWKADVIGTFATEAEAKAACVGHAMGCHPAGAVVFADAVPSHWLPSSR